jgi:stage II sporulation protein D
VAPGDRALAPLVVQLAPENGGQRVRLALEDYVAGAIAGEQGVSGLAPGTAERVLQLQAVIYRTFAVANRGRHAAEGFDLCAQTHCQVYRPAVGVRGARVASAASATRGRLVLFEGAPIQALFHAHCGGHTSAAADVWGGIERPNLVARPDPFCALGSAGQWRWSVTPDALRDALNGNPVTRVGRRLDGVAVLDRDVGGRGRLLALEGELSPVVRGEEFRRVVMATFGAQSVRSMRFRVVRTGARFEFEGRGNGHGAGLCQAGALGRLVQGASVEDVLEHYYPGTQMSAGRQESEE